MPTYEYACTSCGHHLEVFQSFSDEPLATCPNCDGELRKVFGSIGIVLKGSGFYRTDSRASSNGKTASKDASPKDASTKEKEKDKEKSASSGSGGEAAASTSPSSTSAPTSTTTSTSSPSSAAASAG